MNPVLRTAPSGPEVQYPTTETGNVLTVDNDGKVRPRPNTAFKSAVVFFGPPSGGNDVPALQALADFEGAHLQREIVFLPSAVPYLFSTEFLVNPKTPNITLNEGVLIHVDLAVDPGMPFPAAFAQPNGGETHHVLAANAYGGTIEIVVADAPDLVVGALIQVANNTLNMVTKRTVAAPNVTLRLERPLLQTALSGAGVYTTTTAGHEWTLDGCGATISGTASRFFSLPGCLGCTVKNFNVSDTFGLPYQVCSWDVGGAFNTFTNIVNPFATSQGCAIEVNESSVINDCPMPNSSINLDGTQACTVKDSPANSLSITAQQGKAFGNIFANNGQVLSIGAGGDLAAIEDTLVTGLIRTVQVNVTPGSIRIEDFNCELPNPAGVGLAALLTLASGISAPNCLLKNGTVKVTVPTAEQDYVQTNLPLIITDGGAGTRNIILDNVQSTDAALYFNGAAGGNVKVELINNTNVSVTNWQTGNGKSLVYESCTSFNLRLTDSKVYTTKKWGINTNGAATSITLENSSFGSSDYGAVNNTPLSVRLDSLSSFLGAKTNGATFYASRGTVTNAGASVDVNFADIKASDVPNVQQTSGVATAYTVAVTAGSKFTITGAPGNYLYSI
jgi:hypothetical protein